MSETLQSYIQDLIDDLEMYFADLEDELDSIYDMLSDADEVYIQNEMAQARHIISVLQNLL